VRSLAAALRWRAGSFGLDALGRSHKLVAAVLGALLVVALLVVLAVRFGPSTTDPAVQAEQRAQQLHEALSQRFSATLGALPPWAVTDLVEIDRDGELLAQVTGHVGVVGGPGCPGVEIVIPAAWLTDGDERGVSVSEVRELDPSVCARS
jgi:hypothetical protein